MSADTDMEAEVEPSIETEDRLRQEAEEAEQRKAELDRLAQDAIRKQQAAEKAAQEQAAEKEKIRKVNIAPRTNVNQKKVQDAIA